MKKSLFLLIVVSLGVVQSALAVKWTVINYTQKNDPAKKGHNILVLPERGKLEDYEIVFKGKSKQFSSLRGIKSITWLEKDPSSPNAWRKWTAPVSLSALASNGGVFVIHYDGSYQNILKKNSLAINGRVLSVTIADRDNVLPRRIDEGIVVNN